MVISGLRAWLIQRVSAMIVALIIINLAVTAMVIGVMDFQAWRSWVSQPLINVQFSLLFFALLMHAWVGIRDILLDYIQSFSLRLILLCGAASLLIAMAVWVLSILNSLGHS